MILSEPLSVFSTNGHYDLHIGFGLLAQVDLFSNALAGKQVFILSHEDVAQHYLSSLITVCHHAGAEQIDHLLIPSGEQIKTLETAALVWDSLLEHPHYRDSTLIALGGGVIGDLGGFCGANYMRGIRVIQCPTTLLAQIDAAIGGKTAVNHPRGKNIIGAFHSPHVVIADLLTLKTLPQREFIAGLAELIKYGMTLDVTLLDWLEKNIDAVLHQEPEALLRVVKWGMRLKAEVVEADEKDTQGRRAILNFGHTIAHALENLLDYSQILHGEAVAIGMIVAVHLSLQKGVKSPLLLERLLSLLSAAGLPTKFPPSVMGQQILATLKQDKKHRDRRLQWVLLNAFGETHIDKDITLEQIMTALMMCGATA